MILFLFILWSIGGLVALVPTLIAPIVIIVTALVQPNLKSIADDELIKQSKLGVLTELLNNHETIKTVTGGNYLKERWINRFDQNKLGVVAKIFKFCKYFC